MESHDICAQEVYYKLFDSHSKPKAIFLVDAQGAYLGRFHCNKEALKILNPKEPLQERGERLFRRFFGERFEGILQEGVLELKLDTTDGQLLLLDLSQNAKEMAHSLEIEQNKMIRMGEMIGAITHQWRQPLSSIKLIAQDLLEAYRFGEITQQYLQETSQNISRHVDYLSQTIEDFRNFYKDNQLTRTFDLGKTIADSLKIAEPQMRMQHIKATFQCDEKLLIVGKQNELIQVFLNLIANAQDALLYKEKRDGRFPMEIRIVLKRDEDKGRVLIQDNGHGIDKDVAKRIFDYHYSTRKEKGGTGIGLFLVKKILQKDFNASIALTNPSEWTEFTLTFPLQGG